MGWTVRVIVYSNTLTQLVGRKARLHRGTTDSVTETGHAKTDERAPAHDEFVGKKRLHGFEIRVVHPRIEDHSLYGGPGSESSRLGAQPRRKRDQPNPYGKRCGCEHLLMSAVD